MEKIILKSNISLTTEKIMITVFFSLVCSQYGVYLHQITNFFKIFKLVYSVLLYSNMPDNPTLLQNTFKYEERTLNKIEISLYYYNKNSINLILIIYLFVSFRFFSLPSSSSSSSSSSLIVNIHLPIRLSGYHVFIVLFRVDRSFVGQYEYSK
jgi:hypothetical protein